jgi:proteasome alpha subunit
MIEEPYRWVEAVMNRREYIETQLAGGSPIAAVSCRDGIVLVTVGRARQKLFEIYDRIAMGAIGHPGDIERLRLAAIELASTEGFTRSAADVSLRRLAFFSLSPALKTAFEQVYGAPYLVRMLFAEIGATTDEDLFLRVEYDGAIVATERGVAFSAISGSQTSADLMNEFLTQQHDASAKLPRALQTTLDAWSIGNMALGEAGARELPTSDVLAAERQQQLESGNIEAALLERDAKTAIRYRSLGSDEIASLLRA